MKHHGEALRALIDYALKLTLAPQDFREQDLGPLREAGLSDSGIHDAAAIAAYFSFVNRIASGLGVELEDLGDKRLTESLIATTQASY